MSASADLLMPSSIDGHYAKALTETGILDQAVELGGVSLLNADHTVSVGLAGFAVAQEIPNIPPGVAIELGVAMFAHDIGKLHPLVAEIIDSPVTVGPECRRFITFTHTDFGVFRIEHGMPDNFPGYPTLKKRVIKVVGEHHLYQEDVGDDVSLAMAGDLIDALQQNRIHRPGFTEERALEKAHAILGERTIYGKDVVHWLHRFAHHRRLLRSQQQVDMYGIRILPGLLGMVVSALEESRARQGITLQTLEPGADLAVFSHMLPPERRN
jgi:hypothetical protein